MEQQRVVVIAPEQVVEGFTPLPGLSDEILAIRQAHQAVVLGDPVRSKDIIERVRQVEDCQIIHFGGHLTEEGFVATHEIISLFTITMVVANCRPRLVVLNACSSEKAAIRIATDCQVDVIYTVEDVQDDHASSFASLFYPKLLEEGVTEYADACRQLDPSGRTFRYISARAPLTRRNDAVLEQMRVLDRRLLEVETTLAGDWRTDGLVKKVRELESFWDRDARDTLDKLKEFLPLMRSIEAKYAKANSIPISVAIAVIGLILVLGLWGTYLLFTARIVGG